MTNLEFMRRFAKAGSIGLFGGSSAIDRAIRLGQQEIIPGSRPSLWSHAAVFEGERTDGRHWLIESDIDVGRGQVRNGVQENRIEKYSSEKEWPNLAIMDFDLTERQIRRIVVAGLDCVARRTPYDLRGILETYWAMMRRTLDQGRRKDSTFCSAFVRAVFHHAGIDLVPGVAVQHTLPEHVSRTLIAHTSHVIVREEK
jgi:hypothetical protein